MDDTLNLLEWTFIQEIPVPAKIQDVLAEGEQATGAYSTIRDVAVFTDRRLIVMDTQGMTGVKKEIYSIPYHAINMWSTENAGIVDFNSEVTLWTRAGKVKITLRRGIDVRQFDRLIAKAFEK